MTLIETNILLDIVTDGPDWAGWSVAQLDSAAVRGPLVINHVVYAELSVRFATIEALEAVIGEAGASIATIPRATLFLAGKVFQRYRAAGGVRTGHRQLREAQTSLICAHLRTCG